MLLSKLRTRWLIFFLLKNGLFQRRPFSLTVPTYLPNRLTTAAWLGCTVYRPIRLRNAVKASRMAAKILAGEAAPLLSGSEPMPVANSQTEKAATMRTPSRNGMPGSERMGFSFMAGLVGRPGMGFGI